MPQPPPQPLPPFLTSSNPESWGAQTFLNRLPNNIIQSNILDENDAILNSSNDWLVIREKIVHIQELLRNANVSVITLLPNPSNLDEIANYNILMTPYVSKTFLDSPYLLTEIHVYRLISDAFGFFDKGSVGYGFDYFKVQKDKGCTSTFVEGGEGDRMIQFLDDAIKNVNGDRAEDFIMLSLWGNKSDLSIWPINIDEFTGTRTPLSSQSQSQTSMKGMKENLLSNSLPSFLPTLKRYPKIHIVLDNAGSELLTDLILACYLLSAKASEGGGDEWKLKEVVLHCKTVPYFVSDSSERDVLHMIDVMITLPTSSLINFYGNAIKVLVDDKRLILKSHSIWSDLSIPYGEALQDKEMFENSDLVIFKGDLNYRRLVGDRAWKDTYDCAEGEGNVYGMNEEFGRVINHRRYHGTRSASFSTESERNPWQCSVLAIRCLKSEVLCCCRADKINEAEKNEGWRTNGEWGVLSFYDPQMQKKE